MVKKKETAEVMAGALIITWIALVFLNLYLFSRIREQVGIIEYQAEQIEAMEEDLQKTKDRLFDQMHGNAILEARLHQLEMKEKEGE